MRRRQFLIAGAAASMIPAPAGASTLAFDDSWEALTFSGIPATRYALRGDSVGITAEQSSSVIYRPVPEALRAARQASWWWRVAESVPPTDLSQRGGEDRNISVYFVFLDQRSASQLSPGTSLSRLLRNRAARTLLFVWGGQRAPGTLVPSPYMRGRGTSVILRPAEPGAHDETVDLDAFHRRAFDGPAGVLVGVAISSDSDDTGVTVRAELGDLRLQ